MIVEDRLKQRQTGADAASKFRGDDFSNIW